MEILKVHTLTETHDNSMTSSSSSVVHVLFGSVKFRKYPGVKEMQIQHLNKTRKKKSTLEYLSLL